MRNASDTAINVAYSGTGGGFVKFCAGEIDISNASRPINTDALALCTKNDIAFIELPVAIDALTIEDILSGEARADD